MAEGIKKAVKYEVVRIWPKQKERLVELMLAKTSKTKKRVTEVSLASQAVDAFCAKEERKLKSA